MALTPVTIKLPDPPRLTLVELLNVLDELPDAAFTSDDGQNRWVGSGAAWVARDCDGVNVTAATCTAGSPFQDGLTMTAETTRDTQTECVADSRLAFSIWSALSGATLDAENEFVTDENTRKLGDWIGYTMAQELVTGAVSGSGLATDAVGNIITSTSIANGAVGAMESWLADRIGNVQGVLHVSKTTLAALYAHDAITDDNGRYVTPSGHRIVADGGYTETVMVPSGELAGDASNGWAYITGPVWYKTTLPETLGADWTRLNRSTNILTAIAMAYGLFVYNECSVGAMLITY